MVDASPVIIRYALFEENVKLHHQKMIWIVILSPRLKLLTKVRKFCTKDL